MLKRKLVPAVICTLALAAGCAPAETPGTTGTGGNATTGTGSGGSTTTGTGGSATTTGSGGATTTTGTGGNATTGTGGKSGTGGSTTTGTGGSTTTSTGGSTTTGTGGSTTGTGGKPATGGAGGAVAGTGGAGVTVSASCKIPTWPTATGSPVNISGTQKVSGAYDGKMALHDGSLNDCSKGDQSSTTALFEIADGGSIKNVIFGAKVGDGIHCLGSCTIDNVWFPYVCDDAISALGDNAKVTISNSGFKGARDKTIQMNGNKSTITIDGVYVETAGKLVRSCGSGGGCGPASSVRTINVSNVVAIGVGQVVGISSNDTATLKNICAYRTPQLCHTYQPGSDNDAVDGANGVGEGPGKSCIYASTESHALVNKVSGSLSTDILCPGPNSIKTGSTATACVTGFDTCLKNCAPGGFGFKAVGCTAGKYADVGAAGVCSLPADAATAAHFASSNMSSATSTVTANGSCTSLWSWGKDASDSTHFCMCVMKPGYYQKSTTDWTVWDCQSPWW